MRSQYLDGSGPMRAEHSGQVEYRGLVVASKVKSRNIFSDIGSCFVGCCGGEIKDLSKLTNDIRQTTVLGTWCNSVTPNL